jgi:pyruvate dehydrogenase E2 component (dihydrolipoamide acetyltransferase)
MRDLLLPKVALGEDDEMTLLAWLVEPGETFGEGQPLLQVETDKASMEVEAPFDGVLAKIVREAGTDLRPGDLIALVADLGEDYDPESLIAPTAADGVSHDVGSSRSALFHGELRGLPTQAATVAPAAPPPASAPVATAPAVALQPQSAGPHSTLALSRHRQAIARSMGRSNDVPQFAVFREVGATGPQQALARLREHEPGATFTDVVLIGVAAALRREPALNAWFDGGSVHRFEHANLALAVDGPEGVVAPVIRAVDRLTTAELVGERARLVESARQGKLSSGDLLDGTFTVSNIGPLGAHALVPLLTPPQVAIVALGRVREGSGGPVLAMTLSGDHRAIDGADGARFLAALEEELTPTGEESP